MESASENIIKMHCKCGKIYELKRKNQTPIKATSIGCNYCPSCDNDDRYYKEWYNYDTKKNEQPEVVDINQLELFKQTKNDTTI